MRDWTDFLLRMGFGPSTLPHSAHLEGWASHAAVMDVLFGLSALGKELVSTQFSLSSIVLTLS